MIRAATIGIVSAWLLAGCAWGSNSGATAGAFLPEKTPVQGPAAKIRHVVIIFQENRSVDNLFNGLPDADTVRSGKNSAGKTVVLRAVPLASNYDISHEHSAFIGERANGLMNGFDLVASRCIPGKHCPPAPIRAYAYVPHGETKPYFSMAERYTFADRFFQTNEGPSFPAHQYIISGTSTIQNGSPLRAAGNPYTPAGRFTGGCDSPLGSFVALIDPLGNERQAVYPCLERLTLMDLLTAKARTWRYYVVRSGPGLWNGPDAILHIHNSPKFSTEVVAPPKTVISDIKQGRLADVVWVTPTFLSSDHAALNNGSGPSWVAAVVNTIGHSAYWKDTAIFVTWDDWGGWYDHVPPPQYNSYELGFRVPFIAISPYAKRHYVSHRQHEFGSILHFAEEVFNLGSLHTTDERADDLSDCFDFTQAPRSFETIAAPMTARDFLRQESPIGAPDDD
ncbi:MAG: hypothetical protein JO263_06000 [Candidatus Eremiobacteraeota bacterium]|nr:hypothetical protein [Candidatus Eremiobacteraeota bacterium]